MNSNIESLKNLLNEYQKVNSNVDETLVKKEVEIDLQNQNANVLDSKKVSNHEKIKFEYSPEKVEYYQYNGFLYRREINNGQISWEIMKNNISNKLYHDIQIKILEEKISNLGS